MERGRGRGGRRGEGGGGNGRAGGKDVELVGRGWEKGIGMRREETGEMRERGRGKCLAPAHNSQVLCWADGSCSRTFEGSNLICWAVGGKNWREGGKLIWLARGRRPIRSQQCETRHSYRSVPIIHGTSPARLVGGAAAGQHLPMGGPPSLPPASLGPGGGELKGGRWEGGSEGGSLQCAVPGGALLQHLASSSRYHWPVFCVLSQ